jgi:hypothetical protein
MTWGVSGKHNSRSTTVHAYSYLYIFCPGEWKGGDSSRSPAPNHPDRLQEAWQWPTSLPYSLSDSLVSLYEQRLKEQDSSILQSIKISRLETCRKKVTYYVYYVWRWDYRMQLLSYNGKDNHRRWFRHVYEELSFVCERDIVDWQLKNRVCLAYISLPFSNTLWN